MKSVRIDLPILLPELPDVRDACVRRLQELLSGRPGILDTHVVEEAMQQVEFAPSGYLAEHVTFAWIGV